MTDLILAKVVKRSSGKPDRKTRVHVSVPQKREDEICQQPHFKDGSDKEWADWRKQQVTAQRKVIDACVLPLLGDEVKANFSQKAGCPCGCSPGFILTGHSGSDIWIDLK